MSKIVSSTELQKKTREVIDWARIKGEAVVVESYGKPMAAILSYDEYQAYLQYKQARAERFERLREMAGENAALSGLTEDEAIVLVKEVRKQVYNDKINGA